MQLGDPGIATRSKDATRGAWHPQSNVRRFAWLGFELKGCRVKQRVGGRGKVKPSMFYHETQ